MTNMNLDIINFVEVVAMRRRVMIPRPEEQEVATIGPITWPPLDVPRNRMQSQSLHTVNIVEEDGVEYLDMVYLVGLYPQEYVDLMEANEAQARASLMETLIPEDEE